MKDALFVEMTVNSNIIFYGPVESATSAKFEPTILLIKFVFVLPLD
jgi:hypothetical protein